MRIDIILKLLLTQHLSMCVICFVSTCSTMMVIVISIDLLMFGCFDDYDRQYLTARFESEIFY